MSDALVWCRFIHFTAVLTAFGLSAHRPLLLGHEPPGPRACNVLRGLACIALVSAVLWLLLAVGELGGNVSLLSLELIIGETFFGKVWCLHLVCCLVLNGLVYSRYVRRPWLPALVAGAVVASLAPVGHGAMLEGWKGLLLMLNQALHMLFAGAWSGGLLLLLAMLAPSVGREPLPLLQRFSGVGYWLVSGLLVTGLINLRVIADGFWPSPPFEGYGFILAIKLGLVVGMLGLALGNRLAVVFAMERRSALCVSVGLEWALGIAAIAAVALLGTLAPTGY